MLIEHVQPTEGGGIFVRWWTTDGERRAVEAPTWAEAARVMAIGDGALDVEMVEENDALHALLLSALRAFLGKSV
jgi:hypothetical protein